MNKRDALRLRPGDYVEYGPHRRMQDNHWRLTERVAHVTPNGGIKTESGTWLPYSHVERWWRG